MIEKRENMKIREKERKNVCLFVCVCKREREGGRERKRRRCLARCLKAKYALERTE